MLKKTALHSAHQNAEAKMGAFAGYDMPLYYAEGVIKEHEWVRNQAGLFDVSHMGQAMVKGPEGGRQALDLVQKLTPSNFEKLGLFRTKYTVLTNEKGGIIDDLMITKTGENDFHFVLNAGRKDVDMEWIRQHLGDDLEFTYFEDWSLLALQGPKAEAAIRDVLGIDLSDLAYMELWAKDDYTMFISRLGYTGEDGFEISVKNDDAAALWNKLLAHKDVKPVGLAARDSLRLEMGYALYGHDIDEATSPVEADLNWVINKNADSYFGAQRIRDELANGTERKRVGVKLLDKGIAREGAEILDQDGKAIGALTSGGFSPTLKEAIGQGYVQTEHASAGTRIQVNVRGRNIPAEVHKMPFIPAQTKSMKKKQAA